MRLDSGGVGQGSARARHGRAGVRQGSRGARWDSGRIWEGRAGQYTDEESLFKGQQGNIQLCWGALSIVGQVREAHGANHGVDLGR